ncbi:MAG: VOC family protein [Spirochaetota bacterium]|nr:VOC family protein [Spirochaetota bacterium]
MAIEKVIEVGVVVKDLDKAIDLFTDVLGAKVVQSMEFEPYGMKFAMCRIGDVDFELMSPTTPDGVIGKFLEKKGEGLHHIALKTDNIDQLWKDLEDKGIKLIDKTPNTYENHKFGFIHPKAFNNVMFEIIQE